MPAHAALHRNLGRAHGFEALELEGTIPADLNGTLYRVGPGIYERFGVRVPHPFEADGIIAAIRVGAGARGAVQVIESAGYREEQAAGRRLYGTCVPRLQQLRNNFKLRSKNTANTSAWVFNRQLFALMEGGKPTQLDPETLETLGEHDFDGVVARTFSAHPHRVASLATTFNFGIRFGKRTTLELFVLPDAAPARKLGQIELPWATIVHDFMATSTHLVFMVCPAKLVLWRALLGIGGLEKLFQWTPSLGTELIVIPLAEPDRFQRIPCDPFWVWHLANGFRRGDELVVDLCRYADFSSFDAIGEDRSKGESSSPAIYHRAVIELGSGRMRSEAVIDGATEFPRVHPAVQGQAHRHTWIHRGLAKPGEPPRDGIARLEVESGTLRVWAPEGEIAVSEPVIVPRTPASGDRLDEDAVWVLSLCHDDRRDRSFVAVLDGRAPEDGPVAKLWFDQPIPLSFHGSWMDADAGAHA